MAFGVFLLHEPNPTQNLIFVLFLCDGEREEKKLLRKKKLFYYDG